MLNVPVRPRQAGIQTLSLQRGTVANNATSHSELFSQVVVDALNKEPKKRSFFEMQALTAMAMEKTFFADFSAKYGPKALQDLLRKCYYE